MCSEWQWKMCVAAFRAGPHCRCRARSTTRRTSEEWTTVTTCSTSMRAAHSSRHCVRPPPSHMCSHIHPAWRAGLHSLSSQACRFPFSVPPSRCPSARARSEPPRRSRSSLLVRACRALPRPGADGASSHGVPSQPFPMASMLTPGAATRLDVVGCLGQASPFVFELFVNERGPGGEPSNRPTARFHRFALAIPPQHHLIHSAAVH